MDLTFTAAQLHDLRAALMLAQGALLERACRAGEQGKAGDAMIYRMKRESLRELLAYIDRGRRSPGGS